MKKIKIPITYQLLSLGAIQAFSFYFLVKVIDGYQQLPPWKFWGAIIALIGLDFLSGNIFESLSDKVDKWRKFYERNNPDE